MKALDKFIFTCAIIAAVACAVLFFLSRGDQRRLQEELLKTRAEIQQLQNRAEPDSPQLSPAELARLQADQREAIKLRGEIVSLKQSLAAAEAAQKSSPSSKSKTSAAHTYLNVDPLPEDNPEVTVLKTKLINTTLESGQAIVLGGWESQPGKRAYVIIQPTRDPNTDQVSIVSKWAEFSENFENRKNLFSLDNSGDQSATIPKVVVDHFLKTLEETTGIDLLSPPVVSTASGRQARISAAEEQPTTQGPVEVGPKIDILPTVNENGQIQLTIQASLTQKPPK